MEVLFTKHADEKFATLARHGIKVSRKRIVAAVKYPNLIDHSRLPLLIAQGDLDKTHILRVVYKKEQGFMKIITFYPGRKSQYEKK